MTSNAYDDPTLLARVERLEAEAEIRRLVSAHQWASDAGTETTDIPDWTQPPVPENPEGRSRRWATNGMWRGSGLPPAFDGHTSTGSSFIGGVAPRTKWMPHMMHFLTNEFIQITGPSSAFGRWYSWEAATALVDGEELAIWAAGRYEIKFVKERGAWRFLDMHFQEIFTTPFDGAGWTSQPHVNYGPGQVAES